MKNTVLFSAAVLAGALSVNANAASDPLKAFPAAEDGYERIVIQLPKVKDPELYRVQLIPGQVIEADCNTRSLRADIREETAKGWGYTYWVVGEVQQGPTTMMACPEGSSVKKFVPVYHEGLVRYNAKMPLVVYVPKGVELRYKIWTAPQATQTGKVK